MKLNPLHQSSSPSSSQLEPGVLSLFRLFTTVVWVLQSVVMIGVIRGRQTPADAMTALLWGQSTFLLVYLWLQPLQRWLGRIYLPLALAVATLVPVFGEALSTLVRMRGGAAGTSGLLEPTRLYFWLLLPVVLISAQYSIRTALLYTTGTALLSLLLAAPLALRGGPGLLVVVPQIAGRWFLFTLAGVMIARIAAAQRSQRRELAEKNAQLARYASTQEELAVSRERNRLARELHDTLAHTLSAVNVQLKALDVLMEKNPQAARSTLRETQELTRTGLHEARRALQALRAQPIEELGLALALKQLAEQTAARAGLQIQIELPAPVVAVSAEVEQQLYRIAEEALTNVIRHAHARQLQVVLRQEPHFLQLSIADDGVGIQQASTANGHYGLQGMHERAALIGGALTIESQPQRGTLIRIAIPQKETP